LGTMRWFVWLFMITFCVHTFKVHFFHWFPFLGFEISQQGLLRGFSYSTRLGVLIVFASLLTLTTSPTELTDSLERLFSPLKKLKLPVHEFALMMTLAIRFIPILVREANRIKSAQLSRGSSLEGSLVQRVRSISPMVLPLFVSAFRRADELAVAMEARNYSGGEARSSFQPMAFKREDIVLLVFSFVFMGFIVFLN
ncbi:energy-coupling factor transporter transmembrane protein EcfT, partial [candidate division KSB1 bacterium]|nr:energy-coupling factor transporter transmembrane protein EcfT [candidate division KSB1 bacterium]NIR70154.1 energy-coupling factor transporter transmembrane protein EcfT [candidate division KSB1 bacterium]NIS28066.1 energy-coupling factor transporter transmembrane protein EcfT [candidate division KSB1 bacterium]NIT74935.1 energy-coupling factor transporter transmembrane protein EcfT [candidate division KSB1 bacterium]NIU28719.1 energy-coupling factor transporter transmembrane protein EcfT [c